MTKLEISLENKVSDIPDLNRFRIGEHVIAEACPGYDRHEGVIIGIELQRLYGSDHLVPSITLLHDGWMTDGFKPEDLRKASPSPSPKTSGVYGPYEVTFIGAGVWAAITDELPPELVDKKVWVTTTPPSPHAVVTDAMVDAWRIAFHKSYDGGKGACNYDGHIRKGLEAALAVPSPETRERGWHDIRTAPTGKSIIICTWWKRNPSSAFRAEGYLDRDTKTWRNQDGSAISEDRTEPTHWQPIPEAPTNLGGQR